MTSDPAFVWHDDPAAYTADADTLIVRMPEGIRSKQTLLASLCQRLRLPGWFGGNWDALEDSLRDLHWLPEGAKVAIVHSDLPFGAGDNRATYFSILSNCSAHWRRLNERGLVVVLPKSPVT